MRMCEHEGEFLPGVYFALRDELSWAETQRIMTGMTLLGDERGDYNEWWLKNAERLRKGAAKRAEQGNDGSALKLADYQRELSENQTGLTNAQEVLQLHRVAVVQGLDASEGLLDPTQVEFIEEMVELHATKIEEQEHAIMELFAADAAMV